MATIRWWRSNGDLRWIALGVALLVLTVPFSAVGGIWWFIPFWFGLVVAMMGVFIFVRHRLARRSDWIGRLIPERPRRKVYGGEFHQPAPTDDEYVTGTNGRWARPELHVYKAGLVAARGSKRRFVPWSSVRGVRLTDDELIVERAGWSDLRCDRAVIDDAEDAFEAIESVRARRRTDGR